jgi:hypothetical protein
VDLVRLHRCGRRRWSRLGRGCACDAAEKLLVQGEIPHVVHRHSAGKAAHDLTVTPAVHAVPRLELAQGFFLTGLSRISAWASNRSPAASRERIA